MKRDVVYVLFRVNTVTRTRQFVSNYPRYNLAAKDGRTFKAPYHFYIERQPQRQGVAV